jgi:hypothetical protein
VDAQISAVSCGGANNCVGVGGSDGAALIVEDRNGVWLPSVRVSGLGTLYSSQLFAVSCPSATNCVAAGAYQGSNGLVNTFTVSEVAGVWSSFKNMVGATALGVTTSGEFNGGALPNVISCTNTSNCVVGGLAGDQSSDSAGYLYEEILGVWQPAILAPTNFGLDSQGGYDGTISSVSCPAAGDCVAGGFALDSHGVEQTTLGTELNHVWTFGPVPGTVALNVTGGVSFKGGVLLGASVTSVSCSTVGNCVAVGSYGDASATQQGFVAVEQHGVWNGATPIAQLSALNVGATHYNTGAQPSQVSCASDAFCEITGTYTDAAEYFQYFTADVNSGVVSDAATLPGSTSLSVQYSSGTSSSGITSQWCDAAGNCEISGPIPESLSSSTGPAAFIATRSAGVWGAAVNYSATSTVTVGSNAAVQFTQCPSVSNCTVIGSYIDADGVLRYFTAQQSNGLWGTDVEWTSLEVFGDANSYITSMSCPAVGYCTVGGSYADSSGYWQGFTVQEVGGIWQDAVELTGISAYENSPGSPDPSYGVNVSNLDCVTVGNCSGLGAYQANASDVMPFMVFEVNGTWSTSIVVPGLAGLHASSAYLSTLTCVSTGNCLAGGQFTDSLNRQQSLVISQVSGAWKTALEVPGTAALNVGPAQDGGSSVSALACATSSNCIVGGLYVKLNGNTLPYVDSEKNGKWSRAVTASGVVKLLGKLKTSWESGIYLQSASCASPGNCEFVGSVPNELTAVTKTTVIDFLTSVSFYLNEVNGIFQRAVKFVSPPPSSSSISMFNSVSSGCTSSSQCVALGEGLTVVPVLSQGRYQFVETEYVEYSVESNGSWSSVRQVAGISGRLDLQAATCAAAGGCAVAGSLATSTGHVPFVATTT